MHTYVCAAQTVGDGVFVSCVGGETHGLWAATVVRAPGGGQSIGNNLLISIKSDYICEILNKSNNYI